jgi:U3 small nucleolar RNA-associated protein 21
VCAGLDPPASPSGGETDGGGDDGGGDDGGGGGVRLVGEDSSEEEEGDDGDASSDSDPGSAPPDGASDEDGDGGAGAGGGPGAGRTPPADCHGRVLLVQASRTSLRIIRVIDLGGIGSGFVPHVGLHPATYVNKILLGGRPAGGTGGGDRAGPTTSMLLLNVRSGKMVHSFGCLDPSMRGGGDGEDGRRGPAAVTALSQSPAVDTVAVGTSDGSVHLVNLLHDVELFSLRHGRPRRCHRGKKASSSMAVDGANAVSSISFRTDGNATRMGVAPLAVGCDDGSVSVWDLTPVEDEAAGMVRRTLLTRMEGAHHGGICKLEYLPGEPLLLSTGLSSNSIVLHVFDAPDHTGRVLRQRRGHTSPPRLLRYLHPGSSGGGILANAADGTDASSCQILSCGGPGDLTLRLFSTARSNLDREFSQGPGLERKAKKFGKAGPGGRAELLLPEVVALATSEARNREWGDMVTIHRDHAMAYVWSTRRGCQTGMPVLRQPQWNISAMKDRPPRSANAASLAISACGNFALVGTLGGAVYKYNLQSGLPRGSYPRDATSLTAEEERLRSRGLKFAGDVGRTMRMLEKSASRGGTMPSDVDQAERDRSNYLDAEARRAAMVGRASHDDAVVGIAIDSLNKTVVTAGADSKLVLWNFVTHMPHKRSPIMLPSPATKLTHVRDSDLAAIAMSDFGVAVFDCSTLTIVRHFGGSRYSKMLSPKDPRIGHTSLITDLQFGPDGRRLFTSSFDGTIRVWDVPTGLCVDWSEVSKLILFHFDRENSCANSITPMYLFRLSQ